MAENSYFKKLLNQFTAANESTIAFSTYDGKQVQHITYPQFAKDILKIAGYFRKNKIIGQHIALICPGNYEFFVTFFATVISQNVAVILNADLPSEILKWQCNKADVSIAYSTPLKIKELNEDIANITWLDYSQIHSSSPLPPDDIVAENADQTVLMMFTSGTTGKSKAVEITSSNLKACAESANVMYETPGMEIALHAIPRYHVGGFRSAMVCFNRLEPILIGRGIRYLFMDIPVFNPKCIVVVPTMLDNLVKLLKNTTSAEEQKKYLGTRLQRICVGGATLNPQIAQYLMDLGITIDVIYGMTETACIATWCSLDSDHVKTIGKPFGGMDCCIRNNEILIKGPTVMKGYYKDKEATGKIMDGEWIHSGDLGYYDKDGYFYLSGRKKNVIILSNGENVNPEEIEETIGAYDSILECMVYGDGKGICADVYTLKKAHAINDIKNYNENTPTYRQIYKVNYTATPLEKTGSGKIKRKENINEK